MAKVEASYSDIWKISYPIILGSLAQTILGLTDTAFLARVGEVELGASAIGGIFYFVMVMLGVAIGVGAQILIARKSGEGKTKEIGKIFDHTFLLLVGFSLFLFALMQWGAPFVFDLFLNSENINQAAVQFIKYRCWGIIPVLITISLRSFYIGIATTRIISYSIFLMTALNVLLAYSFIFERFGFEPMGIAGAGLASSLSELAALIYLLVYTNVKREFKAYSLFKFEKPDRSVFSGIINLSAPVIMQHFISMGSWFLFFVFIEKMGEHKLAISNIIRTTYMIMMTPIWGYSAAANSMTSNLIGQKKHDEVMALLKKISTLSFLTTFILVAFNALFPSLVLHVTTSDPVLISDSIQSLYVVCGAMVFFSISFILFSGVSGTGNTRIALALETVNIIVYLFYVYICAEFLKTKIEWVWVAEILYWLLMGLFSFLYLRSDHWKKIKL